MSKIGFWSNQMCERGTEIALFDYAYYNQNILDNKSYIFYDINNNNNNITVINKFKKHFIVFGVNSFEETDNILQNNNIKIIYIIKAGYNDGIISKVSKNIIHCVFDCSHPHGDFYCSVSEWVPGNDGKYKVLPHMINLPDHNEDMREILQIPEDSIIIGRHGGYDTFNLPIVQSLIYNIAKNNKNIYFVFVNTRRFCNILPNIIHLDNIIDLYEKRKFINTCDAMIWGRDNGETFGLAIAEFSSCNKPVIACKIGDLAHYHLLNDKGLWYSNLSELRYYITNIKEIKNNRKDWNAYKDYTPEKVMKIFNDILKSLES